jgi:hypothetical protein
MWLFFVGGEKRLVPFLPLDKIGDLICGSRGNFNTGMGLVLAGGEQGCQCLGALGGEELAFLRGDEGRDGAIAV